MRVEQADRDAHQERWGRPLLCNKTWYTPDGKLVGCRKPAVYIYPAPNCSEPGCCGSYYGCEEHTPDDEKNDD